MKTNDKPLSLKVYGKPKLAKIWKTNEQSMNTNEKQMKIQCFYICMESLNQLGSQENAASQGIYNSFKRPMKHAGCDNMHVWSMAFQGSTQVHSHATKNKNNTLWNSLELVRPLMAFKGL